MKKKIFILVGASGSGKTWVANQIRDKFTYVAHDTYGLKSNSEYVRVIAAHAAASEKPIVCDTPFSLSQIAEPLLQSGFEVNPVFIVEKPSVTRERYEKRYKIEKKGQEIMPQGHLTRIETYRKRAEEIGAPVGTSQEILDYMRNYADKKSNVIKRPESRQKSEAHNPQRDNERNEETKTEAVQDIRPQDLYVL